jgi:hypothetical protein
MIATSSQSGEPFSRAGIAAVPLRQRRTARLFYFLLSIAAQHFWHNIRHNNQLTAVLCRFTMNTGHTSAKLQERAGVFLDVSRRI